MRVIIEKIEKIDIETLRFLGVSEATLKVVGQAGVVNTKSLEVESFNLRAGNGMKFDYISLGGTHEESINLVKEWDKESRKPAEYVSKIWVDGIKIFDIKKFYVGICTGDSTGIMYVKAEYKY